MDYFIAGPDMEVNKAASAQQHRQYTMNMVMYVQELDAPKAHFLCRSRMAQNHIMCHLGTKHKHFESHSKREGRLQEHQILAHLVVNEIAVWCNGFVIVPKPNDTIYLCLNPV